MGLFVQSVAVARDPILIGLGIYATVILEKRLKLKETEIEVRKATENHLKGLQAPALSKDLQEISQLADSLSEKNRELQARIEKESESGASRTKEAVFAGMTDGLLEGLVVLNDLESISESGSSVFPDIPPKPLEEVIVEKRKQLQAAFFQAIKGELVQLPNRAAFLSWGAQNAGKLLKIPPGR